MKSLFLSFVLFMLFSGCSHTTVIKTDSSPIRHHEQKMRAKNGKLSLKDGRSYQGVRVTKFSADSITWFSKNSDLTSAANSDVAEVRYKNHFKGAFQGLGLGILSGAVFGVIVGYSADDDDIFEPEHKAVIASFGFGILGGMIGLPVGALVGSKQKYKFETSTQNTVQQDSSRIPIQLGLHK